MTHFLYIKYRGTKQRKQHLLIDALALGICAIISESTHRVDIKAYAQEKETWLKIF